MKASNPFVELAKMVERLGIPGVDMSAVIESRRKDINAFVDANETVCEAIEALARKQMEMLTHAVQDIVAAVQSVMSQQGFVPDYTKQAERARDSYLRVMAELGDLAEIARSAQADAVKAISQRVEQSFDEMRTRMKVK